MNTTKNIPWKAIDELPEGYTILGWGGEFDAGSTQFVPYAWGVDSCVWDDNYGNGWLSDEERTDHILYAAHSDSDIVKINRPYSSHEVHDKIEQRNQPLPKGAKARKTYPLYSGLFQYFPHALAAVAHLSYEGNQQHHPDKPLHWDMDKSADELDALLRHVLDEDWVHVAWRGLSNLERKLTGKCTYENNKIN